MWTPTAIEILPATIDLRSSGQGNVEVRQWQADGVVVCNALDEMDWNMDAPQFELCEHCLTPRCSGGGRVCLRRLSGRVVLMPDFNAMKQGDWERSEYKPPRWMLQKGAMLLDVKTWEAFQRQCHDAPPAESLTDISTTELLCLYHFNAPREFLPDYLNLASSQWDKILMTNGSDPSRDLEELRRLISAPEAFAGHEFFEPDNGRNTVSIFLDAHPVIEWPALSSETLPIAYLSDGLGFRACR